MKTKKSYVFYLVFFLLLGFNSFSQKISINELKNLHAFDWDAFDTFVLTKGYEYSSSKEEGKYSVKTYSYNETADTMASRFITKYVDNSNLQKLVTWQTSKTEEYLWFKNQIVSNGFIFIESGQFKKSTVLKYKKDSLTLKLFVSRSPDAKGKQMPIYEISLSSRE